MRLKTFEEFDYEEEDEEDYSSLIPARKVKKGNSKGLIPAKKHKKGDDAGLTPLNFPM